MRVTPLVCLLTLITGGAPLPAEEAKPFRVVGIPSREHGYGNFKTQVLASQKELDAFLRTVDRQDGWNNRPAFVAGLNAGKIDFATEVLLLVRQTEGSGSNKVGLRIDPGKDSKLSCTILREVAEIGTADIADYCYAVVVRRAKVRQVEVWVERKGAARPDKPRETLTIPQE